MRNFTIYKHHLVWSEKLNQGECYGLAFPRMREKQEIHTAFLWENFSETDHLGDTGVERVTLRWIF